VDEKVGTGIPAHRPARTPVLSAAAAIDYRGDMAEVRAAVLCGGPAGGVAEEIACDLAAGGARVFVPVVAEGGWAAGAASTRIVAVGMGSSKAADSESLVDALWREAGGLDAAVLAPEPPGGGSALGTDLKVWKRELDRALKVPFFLARALGLRMTSAGRGCLVIVAGSPHAVDQPAAVAGVTESGLVAMAQGLAKALPAAVRVNALVAGTAVAAAAAQSGRASVLDLARLVRCLVLESPVSTGTIVRLGRGGPPDASVI
jgi:hypothetical protein